MRKGTTNTKLKDSYDIIRAYAQLYNKFNNDEVDAKKARVLLAILNVASNAYRNMVLESQYDDLKEMIDQINKLGVN